MPTAEDETLRRRPASVKLRASAALTKTANAPRLSIRRAAARPDFVGTLNQGRAAAVSVSPAIPTRRMGEPEVAKAAVFLASNDSSFVTGSELSSMAAVFKF
jgi:NAD(P)-dependent dehydrogenase (short-subunit alcohol dehydrogenase family)